MIEYIEREAVIDTLYAAFKKYWKIPCSNVDMAVQRDVVHTKNKIYEIPAADVSPVVRCKDCKYWEDGWFGYCTKCHAAMIYDGFCSNGERRADND